MKTVLDKEIKELEERLKNLVSKESPPDLFRRAFLKEFKYLGDGRKRNVEKNERGIPELENRGATGGIY